MSSLQGQSIAQKKKKKKKNLSTSNIKWEIWELGGPAASAFGLRRHDDRCARCPTDLRFTFVWF